LGGCRLFSVVLLMTLGGSDGRLGQKSYLGLLESITSILYLASITSPKSLGKWLIPLSVKISRICQISAGVIVPSGSNEGQMEVNSPIEVN
jgi:hypothetical protein